MLSGFIIKIYLMIHRKVCKLKNQLPYNSSDLGMKFLQMKILDKI